MAQRGQRYEIDEVDTREVNKGKAASITVRN
jgi:hypothetical protein